MPVDIRTKHSPALDVTVSLPASHPFANVFSSISVHHSHSSPARSQDPCPTQPPSSRLLNCPDSQPQSPAGQPALFFGSLPVLSFEARASVWIPTHRVAAKPQISVASSEIVTCSAADCFPYSLSPGPDCGALIIQANPENLRQDVGLRQTKARYAIHFRRSLNQASIAYSDDSGLVSSSIVVPPPATSRNKKLSKVPRYKQQQRALSSKRNQHNLPSLAPFHIAK